MSAKKKDGNYEEEHSISKHARNDLIDMLDDDLLSIIFLFAAGDSASDLASLQCTNRRFYSLLHTSSSFLLRMRQLLLLPHDEALLRYWTENGKDVPVSSETLGFYQAVHQKHILDPVFFRQRGEHAVPQAALRIQALFVILDKFPPRWKATWVQTSVAASTVERPPNPHYPSSKKSGEGIVDVIITYLAFHGVIPWSPVYINTQEHINISMDRGLLRKYQNSMYQEYSRALPVNFFRLDSGFRYGGWLALERVAVWNPLPLHLKYLVVIDNNSRLLGAVLAVQAMHRGAKARAYVRELHISLGY